MKLLQKMKGDAQQLPPLAPKRGIVLAGLGGVIAMSLLGLLGATTQTALVLGSFGASCVLLFGFPDVPFSQPRSIVAGHFLSSLIGLAFLKLLGPSWWAMSLAAGTAISGMMITRTVHPPAGSNPVIVFLSQPSWGFLLFPTLIGASVLVLVGLLFHNSTREARYPKYWLGSRLEPLFRLSLWKTILATIAIYEAAALVAFLHFVHKADRAMDNIGISVYSLFLHYLTLGGSAYYRLIVFWVLGTICALSYSFKLWRQSSPTWQRERPFRVFLAYSLGPVVVFFVSYVSLLLVTRV
jgi:hypothetical protein